MKHTQKGFTLSEVLVVLLLVGILTAIGVPQYKRVVDKARVVEAEAMLRTIYDSSERLAGEYGFRSYAQLLATDPIISSTVPYRSFARLDMFDPDHLPAGCRLEGEDDTTLHCQRFAYRIMEDGYVAAKKIYEPYAGTYILLKRDTLELSCQAESETPCEVYELDRNTTSKVSFVVQKK